MNLFLKYFASIVPLILPVTNAVEAIVKEAKAGATKKQLALDSLGVSKAVAETIDPSDTVAIEAAQTLASASIDAVVAITNAKKSKAAGASLPAPQTVTSSEAASSGTSVASL